MQILRGKAREGWGPSGAGMDGIKLTKHRKMRMKSQNSRRATGPVLRRNGAAATRRIAALQNSRTRLSIYHRTSALRRTLRRTVLLLRAPVLRLKNSLWEQGLELE